MAPSSATAHKFARHALAARLAGQLHAFVVSQDFDFFDHVHPHQQSDGSWSLRVTLPRGGLYRLYSAFLGRGGSTHPRSSCVRSRLRWFDGDLPSFRARLVSDKDLVKTVGRTTVSLPLPSGPLVAGPYQRLRYHLKEGDRSVSDLKPYLAAWGHTVVLSDDALDYVHAHPDRVSGARRGRSQRRPRHNVRRSLPASRALPRLDPIPPWRRSFNGVLHDRGRRGPLNPSTSTCAASPVFGQAFTTRIMVP